MRFAELVVRLVWLRPIGRDSRALVRGKERRVVCRGYVHAGPLGTIAAQTPREMSVEIGWSPQRRPEADDHITQVSRTCAFRIWRPFKEGEYTLSDDSRYS